MSQPARELTPEEVAEGRRGISDKELSATQVQALVKKMDISKKKFMRLKTSGQKAAFEDAVKKENDVLYFNYPSLFNLHIEDRLDSTFFEMLQLKRKIEKGEMTPEQASAVVGKQLFNRFVPQAITQAPAETPRLSYEDYCRQMGQE